MADPQQPASRARKIPEGRLAEIERRILAAEAPADFVPELMKAWGRSKRQTWDYVARVRKRLAERAAASKLSPEADAELVRALLLRAYRRAEEEGDAKGMTGAARNLGEMTGVIGPRKVELSGPDGTPLVNFDTLLDRLDRLGDSPGGRSPPGAPDQPPPDGAA